MLNAPRAHQPHSGAHPLLKMVFVASLVANSSLLPAACLQSTPPTEINNMRVAPRSDVPGHIHYTDTTGPRCVCVWKVQEMQFPRVHEGAHLSKLHSPEDQATLRSAASTQVPATITTSVAKLTNREAILIGAADNFPAQSEMGTGDGVHDRKNSTLLMASWPCVLTPRPSHRFIRRFTLPDVADRNSFILANRCRLRFEICI